MTPHLSLVIKEVAIALATPFIALLAIEYLQRAWRLRRIGQRRRSDRVLPFRKDAA